MPKEKAWLPMLRMHRCCLSRGEKTHFEAEQPLSGRSSHCPEPRPLGGLTHTLCEAGDSHSAGAVTWGGPPPPASAGLSSARCHPSSD